MAIVGRDNIIELARSHKSPYWRIFESGNKRANGSYVATVDFDIENLGLEDSMSDLRTALNRLSPGRYLFVAYQNANTKKGGIDTLIEVEGTIRDAAVGGFGGFHIEGFGAVTPDNFEQAIEAKLEKLEEKRKKEAEFESLKAENLALKKAAAEADSGLNRGILTIGSLAYSAIIKTPQGKEFIGLVKDTILGPKNALPESTVQSVSGTATIEGTDDEKFENIMVRLSNNNPDFLKQLEKLADLKDKDPDTFQMAVSSLDSF
ncbi:MAG: hypothetical protein ACOYKE_02445 [Ferruginibacter sp.]